MGYPPLLLESLYFVHLQHALWISNCHSDRVARLLTVKKASPRRKLGPTWRDVKDKITQFDREGLVQLVSDLYALNRENKDFLHARFRLDADPLESYRQRIRAAIAPNITARGIADPKVAEAKKVISAYRKAVGDPLGLLDLHVCWCEAAVDFATGCGYEDDSYFAALERQYRDACFALLDIKEPARGEYLERLTRVRDDALLGYGIQDVMDDWLNEIASHLPDPAAT